MAASMRVVNVRNKCASISFKSFLSRNRKIILSSFSHNSKPNDNSSQPEEEEDFFGIPENFNLQQIRLSTTGQRTHEEETQNSKDLTSGSELSRGGNLSLSDKYSSFSLKERRKVTQTSFSTTFGSITLDKTVLDKLPNACTEDVALKAQEILNNLNIGSNTITISSAERKAEKKKNRRSKEFLNQNSSITSEMSTQANHDSFKSSSGHSGASTNYFDEVYFPEQSPEEDTKTSRRTSTPRSGHHIPDSARGTTSRHRSEAYNSVSHASLSEVHVVSESETSKYASLHAQQHESPEAHSTNVVDEQYFGAVLTRSSGQVEHREPGSGNTEDPLLVQDNFNKTSPEVQRKNRNDVENKEMVKKAVDFNEIDLQYFGTTSQNFNVHESVNQQETVTVGERTHPSFHNIVHDYVNPLNLKQNVKESSQINDKGRKMLTKNVVGQKNPAAEMKLTVETKNKREVQDLVHHPHMMNAEHSSAVVKDTEKYTHINRQKTAEISHQPELATDSNVITNEQFLNKQKTKFTKTETEAEKPVTAYEVAMKIRQKLQQGIEAEGTSNKVKSSSQTTEDIMRTDSNIKLDSKGFRVLDKQVPELEKMTSADLVRMLKSRIIFNHDDFLAIDKPYGLPCFSQVNDRVSVAELLPAFSAHLPQSYHADELHLVQGLDRDVSGAIILAKNPEVAQILRGMYKDSELVTQKFWAVTKGVPKLPAGVIDIPIGEAKVGNIYKMVLRPRFMKEEKPIGRTSKASSERAITEYKVLSSFLHAALVECILLTNVKHQVRLHLASGLGTPVLGDHKYSNFAKLAPQKLHKETLELLKIRQASVRHLAMHLHCRSIILKDYKGRMIFLTTHPPSHFRDNMRNLRVPKIQ